jgi:hypothetical protein
MDQLVIPGYCGFLYILIDGELLKLMYWLLGSYVVLLGHSLKVANFAPLIRDKSIDYVCMLHLVGLASLVPHLPAGQAGLLVIICNVDNWYPVYHPAWTRMAQGGVRYDSAHHPEDSRGPWRAPQDVDSYIYRNIYKIGK